MGLFRRKQGGIATVAAMAQFAEGDRHRGMHMLEVAEAVFVGLGAPSRLGTALFSGCASAVGVDEDGPTFGVAAGASLMGYACRMADAARELPAAMSGAINSQLIFTGNGQLDYDAITEDPARLDRLLELTASLADDPAAIAALANGSEGAWGAFSTCATYQLHQNLVRNGLPKRLLPAGDVLDGLLRLGFAIRVVDEVAGEAPTDKAGRPLERLTPACSPVDEVAGKLLAPGSMLDVDVWLSDAASVCISEFEPFTERVLELATLERLGIISVIDRLLGESPQEEIGEDAITAVSNARMGYALRNCETQLVERTDGVANHDALAILLEERTGGHGINTAVIHGVLRDVLWMRFLGGRDGLYETTPGTPPATRRQAIQGWSTEHFSGENPRVGRDVTTDLVEYGYFLHRLFEIRPDCLEDWT